MILITYNDRSLRKHGITRDQVQEAFTDPMRAGFEMSERLANQSSNSHDQINYCQMIAGHTYANVLLEIGVEMISDNALHIFHAQKVSPKYYKQYEKNG